MVKTVNNERNIIKSMKIEKCYEQKYYKHKENKIKTFCKLNATNHNYMCIIEVKKCRINEVSTELSTLSTGIHSCSLQVLNRLHKISPKT